MTLGEKIRYARKCCGLSQGQLAEKMCVSRSAIAKWETDKGMPDIENLKMLSRLLCVSVDSLLDDRVGADAVLIREPYQLAAWGRGCKKVKKDRMIRKRFPDAKICTLLGRPELVQQDKVLDSTLGILTPVPFSSPAFLKSIRNLDRNFYLVEQDNEQFFVTVTDTFLEIQPLIQRQTEKTFALGNWIFIRCDHMPDESSNHA